MHSSQSSNSLRVSELFWRGEATFWFWLVGRHHADGHGGLPGGPGLHMEDSTGIEFGQSTQDFYFWFEAIGFELVGGGLHLSDIWQAPLESRSSRRSQS